MDESSSGIQSTIGSILRLLMTYVDR